MDETQVIDIDFTQAMDNESYEEESSMIIVGWLEIENRKHELREGSVKVGRDPTTCSIVLENQKTVSKEHAIIEVERSSVTLMDLGSRNKTRIQKMVLKPNVVYALRGKEVIKFGAVEGIFTWNSQNTDTESDEESSEIRSKENSPTTKTKAGLNMSHDASLISPTPQISTKLNLGIENSSSNSISDFIAETPMSSNSLNSRNASKRTLVLETPPSQSTPFPSSSKSNLEKLTSTFNSPISEKGFITPIRVSTSSVGGEESIKQEESQKSDNSNESTDVEDFFEREGNNDDHADSPRNTNMSTVKDDFYTKATQPFPNKMYSIQASISGRDETQDILSAFGDASNAEGNSGDDTQDILNAFEEPTQRLVSEEEVPEGDTQNEFDRPGSNDGFRRPFVTPARAKINSKDKEHKLNDSSTNGDIFDAPTQVFQQPDPETKKTSNLGSKRYDENEEDDIFNMPTQCFSSNEIPKTAFSSPSVSLNEKSEMSISLAPTQVFNAESSASTSLKNNDESLQLDVDDLPTQVFNIDMLKESLTESNDRGRTREDGGSEDSDEIAKDVCRSDSDVGSSKAVKVESHNISPDSSDCEGQTQVFGEGNNSGRSTPVYNDGEGQIRYDSRSTKKELEQPSTIDMKKANSAPSSEHISDDDSASSASETLLIDNDSVEESMEQTQIFSHSQLIPKEVLTAEIQSEMNEHDGTELKDESEITLEESTKKNDESKDSGAETDVDDGDSVASETILVAETDNSNERSLPKPAVEASLFKNLPEKEIKMSDVQNKASSESDNLFIDEDNDSNETDDDNVTIDDNDSDETVLKDDIVEIEEFGNKETKVEERMSSPSTSADKEETKGKEPTNLNEEDGLKKKMVDASPQANVCSPQGLETTSLNGGDVSNKTVLEDDEMETEDVEDKNADVVDGEFANSEKSAENDKEKALKAGDDMERKASLSLKCNIENENGPPSFESISSPQVLEASLNESSAFKLELTEDSVNMSSNTGPDVEAPKKGDMGEEKRMSMDGLGKEDKQGMSRETMKETVTQGDGNSDTEDEARSSKDVKTPSKSDPNDCDTPDFSYSCFNVPEEFKAGTMTQNDESPKVSVLSSNLNQSQALFNLSSGESDSGEESLVSLRGSSKKIRIATPKKEESPRVQGKKRLNFDDVSESECPTKKVKTLLPRRSKRSSKATDKILCEKDVQMIDIDEMEESDTREQNKSKKESIDSVFVSPAKNHSRMKILNVEEKSPCEKDVLIHDISKVKKTELGEKKSRKKDDDSNSSATSSLNQSETASCSSNSESRRLRIEKSPKPKSPSPKKPMPRTRRGRRTTAPQRYSPSKIQSLSSLEKNKNSKEPECAKTEEDLQEIKVCADASNSIIVGRSLRNNRQSKGKGMNNQEKNCNSTLLPLEESQQGTEALPDSVNVSSTPTNAKISGKRKRGRSANVRQRSITKDDSNQSPIKELEGPKTKTRNNGPKPGEDLIKFKRNLRKSSLTGEEDDTPCLSNSKVKTPLKGEFSDSISVSSKSNATEKLNKWKIITRNSSQNSNNTNQDHLDESTAAPSEGKSSNSNGGEEKNTRPKRSISHSVLPIQSIKLKRTSKRNPNIIPTKEENLQKETTDCIPETKEPNAPSSSKRVSRHSKVSIPEESNAKSEESEKSIKNESLKQRTRGKKYSVKGMTLDEDTNTTKLVLNCEDSNSQSVVSETEKQEEEVSGRRGRCSGRAKNKPDIDASKLPKTSLRKNKFLESELEVSYISENSCSSQDSTFASNNRGKNKSYVVNEVPRRSKTTRSSRARSPSCSKEEILWSPAQRQSAASKQPKVLFTTFKDTKDENLVKNLGGKIAESPSECTVLVTNSIKRTCKLLACVGKGVPIVSVDWLNASKRARCFVDPWNHLVSDGEAEKKFGFKLKTSLETAKKRNLLCGFSIFVTDSVKPPPDEMREIVECAGGEYMELPPKMASTKVLVVTCDEDKKSWTAFKKLKLALVSSEFILTGLLRQKIMINEHKLS